MTTFALAYAATNNCVKSSTAGTVTGVVIIAAFIGGIVALAVANGRVRRRLGMANAELDYLRPENARLQQWVAHLTGSPRAASAVSGDAATGDPVRSPVPAQWHADPSARHELRFWDGTAWTEQVADQGVTSADPRGSGPLG